MKVGIEFDPPASPDDAASAFDRIAKAARRNAARLGGTYFGLCDVGGCGNAADGPEVALLIPIVGVHLEVSLCSEHQELTTLIDREQSGLP